MKPASHSAFIVYNGLGNLTLLKIFLILLV